MNGFKRAVFSTALTGMIFAVPAASFGQESQPKQQKTPEEHGAGSKAKGKGSKAGDSSQAASERQSLKGSVVDVQKARVQGGKEMNTIVLIRTEDGRQIAVDLAEGSKIQDVKVTKGVPIEVEGTLVDMKGEPVFIANRVRVGDQTKDIERTVKPSQGDRPKMKQVSGQISKMREVGVKGTDAKHQVAVLQVGKRQLYADLGPTEQLAELGLKEGSKVEVDGIGVRSKGRAILLAQKIQSNGKSVEIERQAVPSPSKLPGMQPQPQPPEEQSQPPGEKQLDR